MAQYVEEQLDDNGKGLFAYMRDTTDLVKEIEKMEPIKKAIFRSAWMLKNSIPKHSEDGGARCSKEST